MLQHYKASNEAVLQHRVESALLSTINSKRSGGDVGWLIGDNAVLANTIDNIDADINLAIRVE